MATKIKSAVIYARISQDRDDTQAGVKRQLADCRKLCKDMGLQVVAEGVAEVRRDRPQLGVLAITHYQRLLDKLRPDVVHILVDGRIVERGGPDLAARLEAEGYEVFRPAGSAAGT